MNRHQKSWAQLSLKSFFSSSVHMLYPHVWGHLLESGLTVRQSGLLHCVAEGSGHIRSIRLHRQLVASERLQRLKKNLLGGAVAHKHGCLECTVSARWSESCSSGPGMDILGFGVWPCVVGDQRSVGRSGGAAAHRVVDDAHVAEARLLPLEPDGGGAVGHGLDATGGQWRWHGQLRCWRHTHASLITPLHYLTQEEMFVFVVEYWWILRLTWAFSVLPFQSATAPSTCLLKAQTFTSYWRFGTENKAKELKVIH